MPKKVLIALPPAMLEMCDFIAVEEHRTRSDLIREALRRYIDNYRRVNRALPLIQQATDEPLHTSPLRRTSGNDIEFASAV